MVTSLVISTPCTASSSGPTETRTPQKKQNKSKPSWTSNSVVTGSSPTTYKTMLATMLNRCSSPLSSSTPRRPYSSTSQDRTITNPNQAARMRSTIPLIALSGVTVTTRSTSSPLRAQQTSTSSSVDTKIRATDSSWTPPTRSSLKTSTTMSVPTSLRRIPT